VRDEQHRLLVLLAQAQQQVFELQFGLRIQRAKRLVHQQER
jgi:hypothetical protein